MVLAYTDGIQGNKNPDRVDEESDDSSSGSLIERDDDGLDSSIDPKNQDSTKIPF